MNDDELLQLLRATDPMPPKRPVASASSPEARRLLEEIMSTDTSQSAPSTPGSRRPLRQWPALAAAAAVAVVVALGIWQLVDDDPAPRDGERAAAPLELTLTPFDPLTSSCMVFDPAQLEGAQVAFAGRVSAIGGGSVTLDVGERYSGEVPDTVTLDAGGSPALDGVAFEEGATYLIAASDGVVAGCGSSGPDDPTLRAAYEQVFGS